MALSKGNVMQATRASYTFSSGHTIKLKRNGDTKNIFYLTQIRSFQNVMKPEVRFLMPAPRSPCYFPARAQFRAAPGPGLATALGGSTGECAVAARGDGSAQHAPGLQSLCPPTGHDS